MRRAKETLKLVVGRAAELAMPHLAREIDEGRSGGRAVKLKQAILYSRMMRCKARGDLAEMQKLQAAIWSSDASDKFYDLYTDRFDTLFLGPHYVVVEALKEVLEEHPGVTRLVEIGCGDGRVLAHCAEALPGIEKAVGLDINPTIIERNKASFAKSPKLSFACGDAAEWVSANPAAGTLLMTYGGVMEYFTPESLIEMFRGLAMHGPAAVALVEPVAAEHDVEKDVASQVHSQEHSFSHNYRHLLRSAGFELAFAREMEAGGIRWSLVVGRAPEVGTAH